MSNIDKRPFRADGGDISTDRLNEIADYPYGDEEKCWLAKRLLALLNELKRKPIWINQCDKTVPAALRYLAENPRPIGGNSPYNTEHLYDLAREIEIAASHSPVTQPVPKKLKVHMPESFHPDGDIDAPLVLDELEVIEAIVEAGGMPVTTCTRCKCELDLSHRPDGTHYCHPSSVDVKGA